MAATRPKRRADLTVVELDGEAVIYDGQRGKLHHLNPTATLVFQLCDGTATVKRLAVDIGGAFNLPDKAVERQVRALVRELEKAKLLQDLPVTTKRRRAVTDG